MRKILYPLKADMFYFLLIWIAISLPNIYLQANNGNWVYSLYLLMMYYIIAYLVVLIVNLNAQVAKMIKPILLILVVLFSMANLYCAYTYKCLLSNDFIQIIAGTNPNEAKEYLETFVSWNEIVIFIFVLLASVIGGLYLSSHQITTTKAIWLGAGFLLIISIIGIGHNSGIIEEEFKNAKRWDFAFDEIVDLRKHLTYPQIIESDTIHPKNVVIILGESFSPNHSSLYGYDKQTNPLLSAEKKAENLFVFSDVTSPSTHTTAAFKYLLNTNLIDRKTEKPWYDNTNLIEVMKIAGYHSTWISNQSEKGMFDNIPSGHAKLCDESIFVSEEGGEKFDGVLVDVPIRATERNCIIYHLMGQHENFEQRYPKAFEKFKIDNYKTYPKHQRSILAAYDNATLYNDYVVYSIMHEYQDKDAVVFYFSDHALDVFDTDSNYFGHAQATYSSRAHAKKIPFMIYFSPISQRLYPSRVKMVKESIGKTFCVDRFIYALMDMVGYKFIDNNDVWTYSLFHGNN